jgi:3,4-dihydroxy 2-butanone 4-phosphate synthase/GTP cyclohydrolase II
VDALPHLALTVGGVGDLDPQGCVLESAESTLVRVHRRHLLGDVFGDLESSSDGATGVTLRSAMRLIQKEGRGAVVYLRPETPSEWAAEGPLESALHVIRPPGSLKSEAAEAPATAVPAQVRELGIGCQILRELGLRRLRLLTNHQTALPGLDAFGLEVVERVPIPLPDGP